ncbi:unnamed protein product [Miscanthus lutarioriparius]|uniref:Uncharacterized protein n=1 Tax=Miscanthus lutarioriparius TaxID=422564 RepID=A0A811NMY5_9POAL|nr:unnamed protein product [Miscanthus lutarioriparius]
MTTTMQSGGGGDEEQGVLAGRPPRGDGDEMEIGWPTDVRHVAHVTFDRFHGFRGVPEELLQQQQPGLGLGTVEDGVVRAPSASKTVFGVSTESMQCAYDGRGNSVPTVLLHLQRRLYDQGGLRAEGIFRVAADGAQEQYARDQLNNSGVVPDGVDVHCIAGLVKAWFRELPGGLLDALPAEEVTRCQTEDDCARLCRARLPAPRAALLDWAVNLMADVAREEKANKMGTRNVAMVFAPNMTRADDPLTALGHAVQLMNFLNMLVERALKHHHRPSSSSSASSVLING